jgi:cytochrome b561
VNDLKQQPFSPAEALRIGWRTTISNLKLWLVLGAFGAFLSMLGQALSKPPAGPHVLLGVGVHVLQTGLALLCARVALRLYDGKPVALGKLSELLSDFFTYLLTSVLFGLVCALGLALLIVPGVLWGLKYGFATWIVADQKTDPFDALHESARLTHGVRGKLFVFALLAVGMNLLGTLALGIGLLVTLPTTLIAAAHVFRRLQATAPARAAAATSTPTMAPSSSRT